MSLEGLFARMFANTGDCAVMSPRQIDRIAELFAEIKLSGRLAMAFATDETRVDSVIQAFDAVESRFGPVDKTFAKSG